MSEIRNFRDLIAWQRAMRLVTAVYALIRQMPASERFDLARQMRRAAVSVPSNIAEGYARQNTGDYLKHLRIARGSLAELITQVEVTVNLKMVKADPEMSSLLAETDRVLQGLIRSIERKGRQS